MYLYSLCEEKPASKVSLNVADAESARHVDGVEAGCLLGGLFTLRLPIRKSLRGNSIRMTAFGMLDYGRRRFEGEYTHFL